MLSLSSLLSHLFSQNLYKPPTFTVSSPPSSCPAAEQTIKQWAIFREAKASLGKKAKTHNTHVFQGPCTCQVAMLFLFKFMPCPLPV